MTFSPTNIGTGLKISIHVRLPKLALNENRLKELCYTLGLSAREVTDQHHKADGDFIYDISNRSSVGQTEFELLNSVCLGVKKLLDEELSIN